MKSRATKIALSVIAIVAVLFAGAAALNHGPDSVAGKLLARLKGDGGGHAQAEAARRTPRIEIVAGRPDTIRFTNEAYKTVGNTHGRSRICAAPRSAATPRVASSRPQSTRARALAIHGGAGQNRQRECRGRR